MFSLMVNLQKEDGWSARLGEELSGLLAFIGATFEEIESYRDAVLLSLETTFSAPMEEFVRREVKTVRGMKADIADCAEQYESALQKFLQLKTSADHELAEQVIISLSTRHNVCMPTGHGICCCYCCVCAMCTCR
jgi:hypothetical protein